MRKIISQEEKNKIIKRNQLIIGIILIFLMVFSTIAFAFSNRITNSEEIKYQGIKFTRDNSGYWSFNIEEIEFLTQYNPKETENINSQITLSLENYLNKPLYFAGESGEHFSEIDRNLRRFVLRVNNACLQGESCENDYPIKDCSNNIIVFKTPKENEDERIYQQENCIFILANYANQVIYTDKFLFGVIGIQ